MYGSISYFVFAYLLQLSAFLNLSRAVLIPPPHPANTKTFEQAVQADLAFFHSHASAAIQQASELIWLDTWVIRPQTLPYPLQNHCAVGVAYLDPAKQVQYRIRVSLDAKRFSTMKDQLKRPNLWTKFKYPADLKGTTYLRARQLMATVPFEDKIASCDIGIPPKDPFRPGQPGKAVLWICGDLWYPRVVVESGTEKVGAFMTTDMGIRVGHSPWLVGNDTLSDISGLLNVTSSNPGFSPRTAS